MNPENQPKKKISLQDRVFLSQLKSESPSAKSVDSEDEILLTPELFTLAWKGLQSPDAQVRLRSSSAMDRLLKTDPVQLAVFAELIVDLADKTEVPEVQRLAAVLIAHLCWPLPLCGRVENLLVRWIDTSPSRLVQAGALQTLGTLASSEPYFLHSYEKNLAWALEWGPPALKALARQIKLSGGARG